MNSVSGWVKASTNLNEPIQTPSGTPITAESRKPAVTRRKLILRSLQIVSSRSSSHAVCHTVAGVGR